MGPPTRSPHPGLWCRWPCRCQPVFWVSQARAGGRPRGPWQAGRPGGSLGTLGFPRGSLRPTQLTQVVWDRTRLPRSGPADVCPWVGPAAVVTLGPAGASAFPVGGPPQGHGGGLRFGPQCPQCPAGCAWRAPVVCVHAPVGERIWLAVGGAPQTWAPTPRAHRLQARRVGALPGRVSQVSDLTAGGRPGPAGVLSALLRLRVCVPSDPLCPRSDFVPVRVCGLTTCKICSSDFACGPLCCLTV